MAAELRAPTRFLPLDLEPKLLTTLREGYSTRDLGRDALAGLVVGIVALPLAIAFAIASGVRPEQGLYTAIIGGFLISAFGGSRVQIGGPTGAFVGWTEASTASTPLTSTYKSAWMGSPWRR